ncbi:POZ domain-containing protein [Coniochaeta sp. PMI_546]|nr:POZ domain-containing protein [Coniochaeta sp. PMI_546]
MSAQNGTSPARNYVTLVSKEGFEFVVLREATLVSPAIRSMLDPEKNFLEAQSGRCIFHDISGVVLEYVVQYMHYWYQYKDKEDVPDMDIPVDLCLEVLMAADFLRMDQ